MFDDPSRTVWLSPGVLLHYKHILYWATRCLMPPNRTVWLSPGVSLEWQCNSSPHAHNDLLSQEDRGKRALCWNKPKQEILKSNLSSPYFYLPVPTILSPKMSYCPSAHTSQHPFSFLGHPFHQEDLWPFLGAIQHPKVLTLPSSIMCTGKRHKRGLLRWGAILWSDQS